MKEGLVITNEEIKRKDGFYVTFLTSSSNPDGVFFTAYQPLEVLNVSEVHPIAAAGATMMLERLQGTAASGAGDDILKTAFDLSGTADTVENQNGRDLTDARLLSPGDRVGAVLSGAAWVSGVQITIYFKFWGRGDYY